MAAFKPKGWLPSAPSVDNRQSGEMTALAGSKPDLTASSALSGRLCSPHTADTGNCPVLHHSRETWGPFFEVNGKCNFQTSQL